MLILILIGRNHSSSGSLYLAKKSPPRKISDPPPNTPYHYLETPVGDSDEFVLKKSVTETQCNRIVNH